MTHFSGMLYISLDGFPPQEHVTDGYCCSVTSLALVAAHICQSELVVCLRKRSSLAVNCQLQSSGSCLHPKGCVRFHRLAVACECVSDGVYIFPPCAVL